MYRAFYNPQDAGFFQVPYSTIPTAIRQIYPALFEGLQHSSARDSSEQLKVLAPDLSDDQQ
jgi:hypothetical protein